MLIVCEYFSRYTVVQTQLVFWANMRTVEVQERRERTYTCFILLV